MADWLDALLHRHRWYRRLRGGHWEEWFFIGPIYGVMWLRCAHGYEPAHRAWGPYKCEDYAGSSGR